jgi:hypothetical protein
MIGARFERCEREVWRCGFSNSSVKGQAQGARIAQRMVAGDCDVPPHSRTDLHVVDGERQLLSVAKLKRQDALDFLGGHTNANHLVVLDELLARQGDELDFRRVVHDLVADDACGRLWLGLCDEQHMV